MRNWIFTLIISCSFTVASAQSFEKNDFQGQWVSVDDVTNQRKSAINLFVKDGKLYGQIARLLLEEDQGKTCVSCKGAKKDQPIEGLIIIEGLEWDGEAWTDGKILDPANGKQYSCTLTLEDDRTLNVRGYLGISLLGRTQTWYKASK
ncbi:MAG: hypothetical protein RLZZ242_1205 [Bacteroidota bacterium]|jgi:uncharacterized protein (DUF2147 family)